MQNLRTILNDAIKAAVAELAADGRQFTPTDVEERAFPTLELAVREALARRALRTRAERFMRGQAKATDDRQAILDLPEFKLIPKFVKVKRAWIELRAMTFAQFQEHVQSVKDQMEAKRQASQQEREAFAELKRLEKSVRDNISTPETLMGLALDRYRQSAATKAKHRRS